MEPQLPQLQQKLDQLETLIQQERDYACRMQIIELKQLQEEKGVLINELKDLGQDCPDDLKQIAGRLREENRRNARLLHTCLNYLRQAMQSCTCQLTPATYGSAGNMLQRAPSGLLLTGRI